MNNKREMKISIGNLIEFILRTGDIGSGFTNYNRAIEGARVYRRIQKSYQDGWQSEVPLKYSLDVNGDKLIIEGRVDGILYEDERVIIDEIKTVLKDLEEIDEDFNELHWAQAKCYGYIYSSQNNLNEIDIQLTYYNMQSKEMKKLRKSFSIDRLKKYFYELVEEYLKWIGMTREWNITRNKSIKELEFPYNSYRRGQRDLAVQVYKTIR